MRNKARCHLIQGHGGWHTDGQWQEWLGDEERQAAFRRDPCLELVMVDGKRVMCELPSDHKIAHRGDGWIWVGKFPIHPPRRA